jgi:hypothetical protein
METKPGWRAKAHYLQRKGFGYRDIAVAVDKSVQCVREELDPEYKAQRQAQRRAWKEKQAALMAAPMAEPVAPPPEPETRAQTVNRMRAEGRRWSEICDHLGISESAARYAVEPATREKAIASAKAYRVRMRAKIERAAQAQPVEPPADLFTPAPEPVERKPVPTVSPTYFGDEIRSLRKQGVSWDDIATLFGMTYFHIRFNEEPE